MAAVLRTSAFIRRQKATDRGDVCCDRAFGRVILAPGLRRGCRGQGRERGDGAGSRLTPEVRDQGTLAHSPASSQRRWLVSPTTHACAPAAPCGPAPPSPVHPAGSVELELREKNKNKGISLNKVFSIGGSTSLTPEKITIGKEMQGRGPTRCEPRQHAASLSRDSSEVTVGMPVLLLQQAVTW